MGFYSCSLLRVKSLKSPEKHLKTKHDTLLQLQVTSVETLSAVATLMSYRYFELHAAFINSVINMKTTFPFHSFI